MWDTKFSTVFLSFAKYCFTFRQQAYLESSSPWIQNFMLNLLCLLGINCVNLQWAGKSCSSTVSDKLGTYRALFGCFQQISPKATRSYTNLFVCNISASVVMLSNGVYFSGKFLVFKYSKLIKASSSSSSLFRNGSCWWANLAVHFFSLTKLLCLITISLA